MAPLNDEFSVEKELIEVRVQVARIDERLKGMCEKQECIHNSVDSVLEKMEDHTKTLEKYKNDRATAVWVFGVLYVGVLAWVEFRSRS
jgi:archaellum component FlaC